MREREKERKKEGIKKDKADLVWLRVWGLVIPWVCLSVCPRVLCVGGLSVGGKKRRKK